MKPQDALTSFVRARSNTRQYLKIRLVSFRFLSVGSAKCVLAWSAHYVTRNCAVLCTCRRASAGTVQSSCRFTQKFVYGEGINNNFVLSPSSLLSPHLTFSILLLALLFLSFLPFNTVLTCPSTQPLVLRFEVLMMVTLYKPKYSRGM